MVQCALTNGYGLYDMAGNVWNWCWDWYDSSWYSNAGATQNDVRGPSSGTARVTRGGSWTYTASMARCAKRGDQFYSGGVNPAEADTNIGFRCVRAASTGSN